MFEPLFEACKPTQSTFRVCTHPDMGVLYLYVFYYVFCMHI